MSKINKHELKEAINAVENKYGHLTPQLIVDEAKNPDHPLHGEFNWDRDHAANQHWLAVARSLLREVTYIAKDVTGRQVEVEYFVHTPGESEQSYSAITDPDPEDIIEDEVMRCKGYIERAQRIADALHMRSVLDKQLQAIVGCPTPKASKQMGRKAA